jgi:hypothetical protein
MEKRFLLERSNEIDGWWVLTDTENLVVLKFKERELNESQKSSMIDEALVARKAQSVGMSLANYVARILREMGQFLFDCHYTLVFPTPVYEIRHSEDYNSESIIRHKYPRFTVTVDDECEASELGAALKKAGVFLDHLCKQHSPDSHSK